MIQTISKIFVIENKVSEFINLFKEMIEPTKKEVGCMQYDMYQDEDDLTIFIVLEQWESKEDFERHLNTDHFNRIVPKMKELMIKDTELNVAYKVA